MDRLDRLDRMADASVESYDGVWLGGRGRRGGDPSVAYRRAMRRYERALGRARTAAFAGAVVVVATMVAAVAGPQPWWLVVTAAGGWLAVTSFLRLRRLRPPARPFMLSGAGVVLPDAYGSGWVGSVVGRLVGSSAMPRPSTGSEVVERLAVVEEHLARVVPAVEALHPSAGHEMRQALAETAPLLHQQVQRLSVLDRLATDLADAPAGVAARQAADQVADRLAEGVGVYERLLESAATLLGAPDMDRGAAAVVGPAVEGLTAYAHGLGIAQGLE